MLIESDRSYFVAGAQCRQFRGGAVYWMPGLQHLGAGCIVEPAGSLPPGDFAEAASEAVAALGSPLVRFYCAEAPNRGPEWARAGLLPAVELALARRPRPFMRDLTCSIDVRPVMTAADWAMKEQLATSSGRRPDGRVVSASDWTALERRKSEAGYAQFYIAELEGVPCATFGLADCGPLLRLKNLAVHPDFQRRGIARAILDFALRHADAHDFAWFGVFALQDGPSGDLYPSCGFEPICALTEWARPIAAPTPVSVAAPSARVDAC
jgi:GNAT superfamily N-acetyltransferase